MLMLVLAVKLVAEIALLAFVGQFVLGLLAGAKREGNFVYQLFGVLTKPFVRVTRALTPRVVLDRHIPLAAVALLMSIWVAATLTKWSVCQQIGMELCR